VVSPSAKRFLTLRSLPSQLLAAAGVGLLLSIVALRFSPIFALGALAAIFLAFVLLKRPEIGLLGILVNSSTLIVEGRPRIPIINKFYLVDLVLLILLGLIVLRALVERNFKIIRTPLDRPLIGFFGLALLSTFIAVVNSSVTFSLAIAETRYVAYYLIFFAITSLVREDRQLRFLLRGMILLATVVAATMIVQFVLGDRVDLIAGRVETLTTNGTRYSGITRVLPPGQSLILIVFVVIAVTLALVKFRLRVLWRYVHLGLLGLSVVLTFNRSFWVGVILALLLLVYLSKRQERRRLAGWGMATILISALIMIPLFANPTSRAAQLVSASVERLGTLGSTKKTLEDKQSTFRWRYFEYGYAVPQIISHPLIGLGLGARYRPFVAGIDYAGFDGRGYTHNGHMWIMMKAGLLGYLCFMWLSLAFLFRAFKNWRRIPDPRMQGSVLGFALAYVGVLVGAIVDPMFVQWAWTPVIGIMMGMNEALFSRYANSAALERGR
jgi:O-antigen ligase